MNPIHTIVLIAHFIGLALILGGFAMQLGKASGFRFGIVLAGAITQFVSGLVLVALVEIGGEWELNHVKIGVKLAITLLALVAAIIGLLRQRKVDAGTIANPKAALPFLHIAGASALANVIIAVAWRAGAQGEGAVRLRCDASADPSYARIGSTDGHRFVAKNSVSSAEHSDSRTPLITSMRCGIGRSLTTSMMPPRAPAFSSQAPKAIRATRDCIAAPAHMTHGSSVTTSVHSSSRHVPSTAAAARSATTSACAVGSPVRSRSL